MLKCWARGELSWKFAANMAVGCNWETWPGRVMCKLVDLQTYLAALDSSGVSPRIPEGPRPWWQSAPLPKDKPDDWSWASTGVMYAVNASVKILGWIIDNLGDLLCGEQLWSRIKLVTTVLALVGSLAVILYGLDLVARPVVAIGRRLCGVWRRCRGTRGEIVHTRISDLDWRGPGTVNPVDNEFFRDSIRARSDTTRKPNNVVIQLDGQFARLARSGARLRAVTRHGQVWEISEVLSTSTRGLRDRLDDLDGKRVCLCRNVDCGSEEDLHVKAYAGLEENTVLDLSRAQTSPFCLCCSWMARCLWAVRVGCLRACCRRRRC